MRLPFAACCMPARRRHTKRRGSRKLKEDAGGPGALPGAAVRPEEVVLDDPHRCGGAVQLGAAGASARLAYRLSPSVSMRSENEDFHDALEEQSEAGLDGLSPRGALSPHASRHGSGASLPRASSLGRQGSLGRLGSGPGRPDDAAGAGGKPSILGRLLSGGRSRKARRLERGSSGVSNTLSTRSSDGAAYADPDSPSAAALPGCMGIFTAAQVAVAQKRFVKGSSQQLQLAESGGLPSSPVAPAQQAWSQPDPRTFQVRSAAYLRSKAKEGSAGDIYRLARVDFFSAAHKVNHVAQHVRLPPLPQLGPRAAALAPGQLIPPLLVVNVQLPAYGPALFGGAGDGPGYSAVFYFALPQGWELEDVANPGARGLLQRFMADGREADGRPTRERLKLIPRVANPAEWAARAPLSATETKLLHNYADKPLLTRPQQRFYAGAGYLEVDLDVHNYAFLARKALQGFLPRLGTLVFEVAFVIQGNRPEELPELVLGCARVTHLDLPRLSQPLPAASAAYANGAV